jgi:hypothetical protein
VADIFHLFGRSSLAPPAWLLFDGNVCIFNEEATQATEAQLAQWQPEEMASAEAPLFVSLDVYRDGHISSPTWFSPPGAWYIFSLRVKVALY